MKPLFFTSCSILVSAPPWQVREQQTELLLGVSESPHCTSPAGAAQTVRGCAWLSLQVTDMLTCKSVAQGHNQLSGLDIPDLCKPILVFNWAL